MKIIDLQPSRVGRTPDKTTVIFSSGNFVQDDITIKLVELRQYVERNDEKLGNYSLITSFVETDKGSIEMIYDEGYRGKDALDKASKFLITNLGISGLVLRSVISLKSHLKNG